MPFADHGASCCFCAWFETARSHLQQGGPVWRGQHEERWASWGTVAGPVTCEEGMGIKGTGMWWRRMAVMLIEMICVCVSYKEADLGEFIL